MWEWRSPSSGFAQRSLVRGVLLALAAFAASLLAAGFPHADALHGSRCQVVLAPVSFWECSIPPAAWAIGGTLYYAGVLILLYSELMILAMVLFLWLYL